MKNAKWWPICLAVAWIAGGAGAALGEDPPPGSEIVLNDGAITESAPDLVEVTGNEGIITCLLVNEGGDETLFLTITTLQHEILIADFIVLGQDPVLGVHWTGQISGQAVEGGLAIALEPAVGATIKLLAGDVEEPDFLVSLTSTPEAAQALVRLWTRASFGYDPGENAGLDDPPSWPWVWYCGCRWAGGGMALCPITWCPPHEQRVCPGTADLCRWFPVWVVIPEWVSTTAQN